MFCRWRHQLIELVIMSGLVTCWRNVILTCLMLFLLMIQVTDIIKAFFSHLSVFFNWGFAPCFYNTIIHRVQKKDPYIFSYIWSINVSMFTIFDRNLSGLCSNKKAFKWLTSPMLCDYPTLWNRTTKLWLNNAGVMPHLSNGKKFKQMYLAKCAKSPSIYSLYSKCPPAASTRACRRACHCLMALLIAFWSRRSHSSTMLCQSSSTSLTLVL